MVVFYGAEEDTMGAEAEIVFPTAVPVLESPDEVSESPTASSIMDFIPTIRSGSYAKMGPRRSMEDEHIRIDDLSMQLGSLFNCPQPSAFYGVFDGHRGPEAATYLRNNILRLFFQDVPFPQASLVDEVFLEEVKNSLHKAFLHSDLALANDRTVSASSGTTVLTALVLGRLLMVANAGDCRAVLCRKGKAIDMSQDHKPICPSERTRIEAMGVYIENDYLNGLSVTRALGDWDMKRQQGSASPLIAEPELRQADLTQDDEFLIIGCDGIWDVMSSQRAVRRVRHGLRQHNDPQQCAKDLAEAALKLGTLDNVTVIVVTFSRCARGLSSSGRDRLEVQPVRGGAVQPPELPGRQ